MIFIENIKARARPMWAMGGALLLVWSVLFIGGLIRYSGSALTYTLFSLVFLAMLVSSFVRQAGYGYLFLTIMLWLGFWLKLVIHLIFPYPFVEPIGRFMSSPGQWDEVLTVATVAAVGVLGGRLIFQASGGRSIMLGSETVQAPRWYLKVRWQLWSLLVVCVLAVSIANIIYGFQQSGLVPRTILACHLNGLVYYALAIGFALCVAALLWWDVLLSRNFLPGVGIALLEGFVSTVSLLSRGIFIFNVAPRLFALYKSRARLVGYTKLKAVLIGIVFVGLVDLSFLAVNMLRDHYYSGQPFDFSLGLESKAAESGMIGSQADKLLRFSVDRWVGLEGAMAIVAYPEKGREIFLRALDERSENGRGMMYQEVCSSYYSTMDMGKFRFTSLPGAAAFFYYTGSSWAVLGGMFLFTLLILCGESWAFSLTQNPILCALVGSSLANIVSQFGVTPTNLMPYLAALLLGTLLIALSQSEWLARNIQLMRNWLR